jgi:hypothetical protein
MSANFRSGNNVRKLKVDTVKKYSKNVVEVLLRSFTAVTPVHSTVA